MVEGRCGQGDGRDGGRGRERERERDREKDRKLKRERERVSESQTQEAESMRSEQSCRAWDGRWGTSNSWKSPEPALCALPAPSCNKGLKN